ncbi:MAG: class I SAM-dependent methyltransferase [Chlamydiae bacterium]|nr:class I SAM-dependent methyltransferase [Chlamydiota bacterium]
MNYKLIDSGNFLKLEKFGPFLLSRPSASAIWHPKLPQSEWDKADLIFSREGKNHWIYKKKVPPSWEVKLDDIKMKIAPTDFGHLGVFPEHILLCRWMEKKILEQKKELNVLNLFAYSGLATIMAARSKAKVCHVDASKPTILWARENANLNNLQSAPIRWIEDDVIKFLKREIKREVFYDGIILDPPSFGRGSKGEVFKIEENLFELLELCKSVLSKEAVFFILSSHTTGFSSIGLNNVLTQLMQNRKGVIESGEMVIESSSSFSLPCGYFSRWSNA